MTLNKPVPSLVPAPCTLGVPCCLPQGQRPFVLVTRAQHSTLLIQPCFFKNLR